MVYKELNAYELKEVFKKFDRDNFSLDFYEYLVDCEEEFELDVIKICCKYTEYNFENFEDFLNEYEVEIFWNYDGTLNCEKTLREAKYSIPIIELDNSFLVVE